MDCLAYGREIEEIQEKNRGSGVIYGEGDDFKYHYKKEDRLKPVLNLVLYWGRRKWKEPLSLRDMIKDMGKFPERMRLLAGDYKVCVIQMRYISDADLQKMDSDLKYVLGIMKCTGSRKKYESFIQENSEYFSRIPKSAADVIDVCTNIKDIRSHLRFAVNQGNEEEANMCRALEEIKKEAENRGIKKGVKQGIDRTNKLIQLLLADGRQEDLARSAADVSYQHRLFREYHI